MIGKEIKDKRPITISEVRQNLEERQKQLDEEEELTYEQKITLNYAEKFGKEDVEREEKAVEEIKDLDIEEKLAVRLVNLAPFNEDQINLVFEKERFDVDEEKTNKILKIIDDLREAK
ncbi:MAG: hypothetical protein ACOCTT_03190 [archaeon]